MKPKDAKLDEAIDHLKGLLRRTHSYRHDAQTTEGTKIELVLSPGFDNIIGFLEFLRYIKDVASGGHSFLLAADESADPPGKMFGRQHAGAVCNIDGDGSDHIVKILVDGKELK